MRLSKVVLPIVFFGYSAADITKGVDFYLAEYPVYNKTLCKAVGDAYLAVLNGQDILMGDDNYKRTYYERAQTAIDLCTVAAERAKETTPERLIADSNSLTYMLQWLWGIFWPLAPIHPIFEESDFPKLQPLFDQQANALIMLADALGPEYCRNTKNETYHWLDHDFMNEMKGYSESLSSRFGITIDASITGYNEACNITRAPDVFSSYSRTPIQSSRFTLSSNSTTVPSSLRTADNAGSNVIPTLNPTAPNSTAPNPTTDNATTSVDPSRALSSQMAGVTASRSLTVITTTVSAYTTYCPVPTTFCAAHTCYTVTEATTITVSDCPCELKSTLGVSTSGQLLCSGNNCFPVVSASSLGSQSASGTVNAKQSANMANAKEISRLLKAIAAALVV